MPLTKIAKGAARVTLEGGPLGIGEDHGRHSGRQLVLDLMEQGCVKILFLEVPKDNPQYFSLEAAVMNKQAGKGLAAIESAVKGDNFLENPKGTPEHKFSYIIAKALESNIRVIFCDKFFGFGDRAQKPANMKIRNEIVTKVFIEASALAGPSRAGCLILFGAAHFEPGAETRMGFIGEPDLNGAGGFDLNWIDVSEEA